MSIVAENPWVFKFLTMLITSFGSCPAIYDLENKNGWWILTITYQAGSSNISFSNDTVVQVEYKTSEIW